MYKVYHKKDTVNVKEEVENIKFYTNQLMEEDSAYDRDECVEKIHMHLENIKACMDRTLKCSVTFPCE